MYINDDCSGCGTCADEACIFLAVKVEGDEAVIDHDACRGCGRCAAMCPEEAIEVVIEDAAFVDKTMERISKINYT